MNRFNGDHSLVNFTKTIEYITILKSVCIETSYVLIFEDQCMKYFTTGFLETRIPGCISWLFGGRNFFGGFLSLTFKPEAYIKYKWVIRTAVRRYLIYNIFILHLSLNISINWLFFLKDASSPGTINNVVYLYQISTYRTLTTIYRAFKFNY